MDQANRAKKETALRAEAKDRKRERQRGNWSRQYKHVPKRGAREREIDTIGVL